MCVPQTPFVLLFLFYHKGTQRVFTKVTKENPLFSPQLFQHLNPRLFLMQDDAVVVILVFTEFIYQDEDFDTHEEEEKHKPHHHGDGR